MQSNITQNTLNFKFISYNDTFFLIVKKQNQKTNKNKKHTCIVGNMLQWQMGLLRNKHDNNYEIEKWSDKQLGMKGVIAAIIIIF